MTAKQAGPCCAVLKPKAVPIHCAFTGGPVHGRLFLGNDGTSERFQRAVAQHAQAVTTRHGPSARSMRPALLNPAGSPTVEQGE